MMTVDFTGDDDFTASLILSLFFMMVEIDDYESTRNHYSCQIFISEKVKEMVPFGRQIPNHRTQMFQSIGSGPK